MTMGSDTRDLNSLIGELSVLAEAPLAKARVMPRQVYLSEELLAREEERIFHKEWLCAGREDDIPEVRYVLKVEACSGRGAIFTFFYGRYLQRKLECR